VARIAEAGQGPLAVADGLGVPDEEQAHPSDPRTAAAVTARPQLVLPVRPAAGLALKYPDIRRGEQGLRPPAEAGLGVPLDIP